jgi:hypothetical protein
MSFGDGGVFGVSAAATATNIKSEEDEEVDERKPAAKPNHVSFEESTDLIHRLKEESAAAQRNIDLDFLDSMGEKPKALECPEGMSPDVFYQLPPEMQKEVSEQGAANISSGRGGDSNALDMDPETLASLPENIRQEVLDQARRGQSADSAYTPTSKQRNLDRNALSKSTTAFLSEFDIDEEDFDNLDEEVKNDIMAERKRRSTPSINANVDGDGEVAESSGYDPETLASLPADLRREVLEQERREREERERKNREEERKGVGAHSVNVPAGYDPETFEALPLDVQQELMEEASRQAHGGGGVYSADGYDYDSIVDAAVVTACPASRGTSVSTSCTYTGDYNGRGKRHGDGELNWANGDKYVGKFKDGFIEGRGTISFHDGEFGFLSFVIDAFHDIENHSFVCHHCTRH